MTRREKLVFGMSAKQQIADRLRSYIEIHFETCVSAAKELGITKQRLSLYTSGKSLPRAEIIDRIFERWGLDLIGSGRSRPKKSEPHTNAKEQLLLLFDKPVSFGDDAMKVIVQRKGNGLVASIHLSANLKVG